ncbi:hypothetical protein, partial [Xanthomonas citri]
LTPRPLALAVVLRVAEGQLHRNRLLGSMIDCGRSGRIVQSFPRSASAKSAPPGKRFSQTLFVSRADRSGSSKQLQYQTRCIDKPDVHETQRLSDTRQTACSAAFMLRARLMTMDHQNHFID